MADPLPAHTPASVAADLGEVPAAAPAAARAVSAAGHEAPTSDGGAEGPAMYQKAHIEDGAPLHGARLWWVRLDYNVRAFLWRCFCGGGPIYCENCAMGTWVPGCRPSSRAIGFTAIGVGTTNTIAGRASARCGDDCCRDLRRIPSSHRPIRDVLTC